jgi:hypothetical protein
MRKNPSNFCAVDGFGMSGFDSAMEEMQLHDFLIVLVPNHFKRDRNVDMNTQLFEQLSL